MTITIREPGSALTHFFGMVLAVFASAPILVKAALQVGTTGILAAAVFMASMILLYGASTLYHSVNLSGRALKVFRKIDHMMIFVLIAGSDGSAERLSVCSTLR
jgi:hemolysin III